MRVRINELSIGDWVQVTGCSGYGLSRPMQVAGLTPEFVVLSDEVYRVSQTQGVPLTAAILEKNGFKRCQPEPEVCRQPYYELTDTIAERTAVVIEDDCHGMKSYWWATQHGEQIIPVVRLRHVHQLQHLQRIEGMRKEVRP